MKIKGKLKKATAIMLAGAMSIAVFTACGEKNKNEAESLSVKEMLADVFDTAFNSNSFSGVFSGEADTASKINATIEFGKGVTDALGAEVKPLSLTSETKLKGAKAGTDISITYDGNNLASLNGVYDNEAKKVYLKVPELSDAYLSVSSDDFKDLKSQLLPAETTDLKSVTGISALSALSSIKNLSTIKVDKYEKILDDYVKVITDKLPDESEKDDFNGKVSEVEYSYKQRTYTLTSDNIKNIIEAVFEKLKSDEDVKKLAVDILGSALGLTEDDYAAKIDEAKNALIEDVSQIEKAEISLIYDDDDVVGIKLNDATMVCVDENDAYAIGVEGEGVSYSFTAVKDGKKLDIDCESNITVADEDTQDVSFLLNIEDFEITDKENGLANGDVKLAAKLGDDTAKLDVVYKAEESKQNSEINISVNDTQYAKITLLSEITNASDVSIPSGTIYTMDEIEKYQSSMKLDKFMANIQKALGDDLTAALSSLSEGLIADETKAFGDEADASDEDAIMLEDYYKEDGTFDYDKLKKDLGEEDYKAFMSQIDIDDFEIDADDIQM